MVNVTDGARYRETSGKSWAEPPLPPPPEPPVPPIHRQSHHPNRLRHFRHCRRHPLIRADVE